MGAIKELYFRLVKLISSLLDNGVKIDELDQCIIENLDIDAHEYQFYLENKDDLINEVNRKAQDNELPGTKHWTKKDFNKYGVDTSDIPDEYIDENLDENLDETLVSGDSRAEHFIDLRGPSGNAFVILDMAKKLAKQLKEMNPKEYNWDKIYAEMTSGDYNNLVKTFEKYFGNYVTIYNADVLGDEDIDDDVDESLISTGRALKGGWNFSSLSAGRRVRHKRSGRILRLTLVGVDHAFGRDSNGIQIKIHSIKDIEPVSVNESKKKNTKERDEILKRILYAKDFTPHKVEYYENMLKNYDDSFKKKINEGKLNEGSDWIYLKSIDKFIDEYTGNLLNTKRPMYDSIEVGDDQYDELIDQLDDNDMRIYHEVMAGNKSIDESLNEGRRDVSEAHPSDDLMANFRSWEQDCDNEKDAEELLSILIDRHPDYDKDELEELAYHWCGVETPAEIEYNRDPHESLLMPTLAQSLNEGCNCGSKKRPKPTIIRRPINTIIKTLGRKKLHENKINENMSKSDLKDAMTWIYSDLNKSSEELFGEENISGIYVIYKTLKNIINYGMNSQKAFFFACEDENFHGDGPDIVKERKEIAAILNDRFDIIVNPMFESIDNEFIMKPLNEVDYDYMTQKNRESDNIPRFTKGMTKFMDPKEIKVKEGPKFDYNERKEGLGHIAKKHKILKDMGYDLDTDIEIPELAPSNREAKRSKLVPNSRFNKLKGILNQEEKAMNKFHEKHLRGKSERNQ